MDLNGRLVYQVCCGS